MFTFTCDNKCVTRMNSIKIKNDEFDRCYGVIGNLLYNKFPILEWFIAGSIRFGYYTDKSDIDVIVRCEHDFSNLTIGGKPYPTITEIEEFFQELKFEKSEKCHPISQISNYPESFIQYSGYIQNEKRKIQISITPDTDFQHIMNRRVDEVMLNNPKLQTFIQKLKNHEKGCQISGSDIFKMLI